MKKTIEIYEDGRLVDRFRISEDDVDYLAEFIGELPSFEYCYEDDEARFIKGQEEYEIRWGKEKDKWECIDFKMNSYCNYMTFQNKETNEQVWCYDYLGD